jgi:6-phosphogluconolactonase (cycloisomerase 2 family)
MPKEGSPAIDAGNNDVCNGAQVNKQDQRGSERPKDGTGNGNKVCDIGAIEAGTAAPGFGSDPVQPGPLDFGNALPGQPQTFILQVIETGRQALTVNSGSISGPNSAAFSIVTSFPIVIPNGGDNVPLELRCEPPNNTPGVRTATLTLTTNDPDKLQVTYDLRCTVPASSTPALGTSPDVPGPIDMGVTPVGVMAIRPLQVWSAGTGTLEVGTPTITGENAAEFIFGAVQPGTILLGCTPAGTGLRVATFNIPSNDPNRPVASFDLLCRGTAVQPPHLATPSQSLLVGLGAGNVGPYDVVVSDDGRFLYATDYGDHMVVAYKRNELGGLELLGFYQNGFGGVSRMERPVFLTLSPDGRNLYVAASQSNAIVTFTRNPETGDLTYLNAVGEGDGYGCFPAPCNGFVTGLSGAYAVAVSPDGRYLYATATSSSALTVLRRNVSDGSLRSILTGANFVQSYSNPDLNGARGLTISPDGLHIYVAALTADTLSVFQRNATNGQVTLRQTVRDGELVTLNPPTFVDGLDGATDVIVSEDGRHVYVTGNLDNTVSLFSRNALTGDLFYVASYDADLGTANGLAGAISLTLSPDGRTLYATGFIGDSVAVFARDANTGRLTQTQQATQPELDGATGIAAAPDGTAVYAVAWNSNRIVNLRLSRPMPEIDSLLPASAAGGSGAFPLVIRGQNFLPTTEVRWNGSPRAVTFVSPTELRVAILANDLPTDPAVTAAAVQVRNLTPGGGTAVANFTITQGGQPPVPSIASIAPQSLPAGASSVQMTVYGANFLPTAQVLWNGAARPTTFINSGELRFTISGAALLNPGAAAVSVVNGASSLAEGVYAPQNSGQQSNLTPFVVAAPGQNPAPTLNSAFPNHVVARGAASRPVTILLTGQHFVEGAQAQWNGADRPTVAISSTQLRVTLTAADVAFGGSGGLRVVNPGPGGGPSNTATFSVFPHALYLPMMTR